MLVQSMLGFPLDVRADTPFARRPDGRRVVLWSEGSLEWGMDVRAVALDGDGIPMGPPVTVSSGRGNAAGQPSLDPGPDGVISFMESSEEGILRFSAAVHCDP
jgi:hypothetical protein